MWVWAIISASPAPLASSRNVCLPPPPQSESTTRKASLRSGKQKTNHATAPDRTSLYLPLPPPPPPTAFPPFFFFLALRTALIKTSPLFRKFRKDRFRSGVLCISKRPAAQEAGAQKARELRSRWTAKYSHEQERRGRAKKVS